MSWVEQNLISHSLIVNSDDCDSEYESGKKIISIYISIVKVLE